MSVAIAAESEASAATHSTLSSTNQPNDWSSVSEASTQQSTNQPFDWHPGDGDDDVDEESSSISREINSTGDYNTVRRVQAQQSQNSGMVNDSTDGFSRMRRVKSESNIVDMLKEEKKVGVCCRRNTTV